MAAAIASEGDLEVVVLHESHGLLAEILNTELYEVKGTAPDQTALFHTELAFKTFVLLVNEFFAEGSRSAHIHAKYENWSIENGLDWLCKKHVAETHRAGLAEAVANLRAWMAEEVELEFWAPDVEMHLRLGMPRAQIVSFYANESKHHLLRLTSLLDKLGRVCKRAGHTFSAQEIVGVLWSLTEAAQSHLLYHSTYSLELMGETFLALNRLIRQRFTSNPTNDARKMHHPPGVTTDLFKTLYASVLVFKRYDDDRITSMTPRTHRVLRLRDPST